MKNVEKKTKPRRGLRVVGGAESIHVPKWHSTMKMEDVLSDFADRLIELSGVTTELANRVPTLVASGLAQNFRAEIKKIQMRSVSALFSIDRYSGSKTLTLSDWGATLAHRFWVLHYCKSDREAAGKLLWEQVALLLFFPVGRYKARSFVGENYAPITDATAFDIWDAYKKLIERAPPAVSEQLPSDVRKAPSNNDLLHLGDPERSQTSDQFSHLIRVDLMAPDKVLIEDFKAWLSNQRKVEGRSRSRAFSEADMRRWSNQKVLAYIDLMIVQQLVCFELEQHEIADLLFPDEQDVDVVERVRKVVKPLAEWLLNYETINCISRATSKRKSRPE